MINGHTPTIFQTNFFQNLQEIKKKQKQICYNHLLLSKEKSNYKGKQLIFLHQYIKLTNCCDADKRHGEHKKVDGKTYIQVTEKIQVNLVKQQLVDRKLRVHYANGITRDCVTRVW